MTDKEMYINEALTFKEEIVKAIYTGDVEDQDETIRAFELIFEFAQLHKDYLWDAAND